MRGQTASRERRNSSLPGTPEIIWNVDDGRQTVEFYQHVWLPSGWMTEAHVSLGHPVPDPSSVAAEALAALAPATALAAVSRPSWAGEAAAADASSRTARGAGLAELEQHRNGIERRRGDARALQHAPPRQVRMVRIAMARCHGLLHLRFRRHHHNDARSKLFSAGRKSLIIRRRPQRSPCSTRRTGRGRSRRSGHAPAGRGRPLGPQAHRSARPRASLDREPGRPRRLR